MNIKNVITKIEEIYQGTEMMKGLTSTELSDWLSKLSLEIVKSEVQNYQITPKGTHDNVVGSVNELLKDIRKEKKLTQRKMNKIIRKEIMNLTDYEIYNKPFPLEWLEKAMNQLDVSLDINEAELKEHFDSFDFSKNFPNWEIEQTGGYNYLISGLFYARKIQKEVLVSITSESVCAFRTPRKGIRSISSIPTNSEYLSTYGFEDGCSEIVPMTIQLLSYTGKDRFEKGNYFNDFFEDKDAIFLENIANKLDELVASEIQYN